MASSGKTIIVTGANSGVGYEATKILTKQGHHVIMACRSKEKAEGAIKKIQADNPDANCEFMQLDTSSLASVRQFADDFHQRGTPLHVLCNNAGIFLEMKSTDRKTSKDGFELTMATNHLGHFLLTQLLLEDLKATASKDGEARIVNTASSLHDLKNSKRMGSTHTDIDDLMLEKEGAFTGVQAYKNSKLANVLFTKKLARDLSDGHILVNTLCPGFIPATELLRDSSGGTKFFVRYFLDGFMKIFKKITRTPQEGGASIVYLATGDEVKGKTGGYYTYDKLTEPSDEAKDEALQEKLWELSEQLIKNAEDKQPE